MLKPKLDPSSDEFVLDQLSDCEQKLVGLVEELSSRELETIRKEMDDEEVCVSPTLPLSCRTNNRIKHLLPLLLSSATPWREEYPVM